MFNLISFWFIVAKITRALTLTTLFEHGKRLHAEDGDGHTNNED